MIARPNRPAAMLLGGLSLEQYAGVTAALAEQFDLSEILEQEGIEPSAWPAASRAWSRAIVEATNLQMVLTEKRRIAEDCLARSLSPLDQDPAAWIGLLAAWGLDEQMRRAIEEHYTKKFSRQARWATEFVKLLAQAQKAMVESKAVAPIPRSLSAA